MPTCDVLHHRAIISYHGCSNSRAKALEKSHGTPDLLSPGSRIFFMVLGMSFPTSNLRKVTRLPAIPGSAAVSDLIGITSVIAYLSQPYTQTQSLEPALLLYLNWIHIAPVCLLFCVKMFHRPELQSDDKICKIDTRHLVWDPWIRSIPTPSQGPSFRDFIFVKRTVGQEYSLGPSASSDKGQV